MFQGKGQIRENVQPPLVTAGNARDGTQKEAIPAFKCCINAGQAGKQRSGVATLATSGSGPLSTGLGNRDPHRRAAFKQLNHAPEPLKS